MNQKTKKTLIPFMVVLPIRTGCGKTEEGFDKKQFDISEKGDSSLIAKRTLTESRYEIEISGEGKCRNFSNENKAPWHGVSKKISKVDIKEGVTSLGDNLFPKLTLSSYFLPKSLTKVSDSAFKDGTALYSYSGTGLDGASNCLVYYYSASVPEDSSLTYWHFVNDQVVLWKEIKTLFIGNSFTFYNDIPGLTQTIARDLGYSFLSDSVTVGSHRLDQYADSNDEYGKIVEEKLKNNSYDYIILQEQSTRPLSNYSAFLKGAQDLQKKINSTQKNCTIRLYSTWGFEEEATARNWTIPEREENIRAKYDEAAKARKVSVHYVGKAFSASYLNYPEINLYHSDNKHPSYAGSYLSALVHASSLLGADIRNTSFDGEGLDEATAGKLKNIAYSTVFNK